MLRGIVKAAPGIEAFKNREISYIGQDTWRHYAVLIPLVFYQEQWCVLFEKRGLSLRAQPGEISFPGGRVEQGETPQQAALRELCEELEISASNVSIWGECDRLLTVANECVHSYLGVLHQNVSAVHNMEVEEVFYVPLSALQRMKPLSYEHRVMVHPSENFPFDWIPDGLKYKWREGRYPILFYRYQERIIWGMTARILHRALELIDQYHLEEALPKGTAS